MKTKLLMMIITVTSVACSENITPQTYSAEEPLTYQVFYDQLAPYGSWMNYSPYGYVWVPDVAVGFSPYLTNGYWLYSTYGWTWYSYYSWGWAPFHYGRWHFDVAFGWLWIPDTVWGPGWVAWRTGGGYCGWAPLGPNITVNIIITGEHQIIHDHWIFVRDSDLHNHHVENHRVDRTSNSTLIERSDLVRTTRHEGNLIYQPGPDRDEWQRSSGQSINTVEISRGNRPGRFEINNNQVEMFRPTITNDKNITPTRRQLNSNPSNRFMNRDTNSEKRPIIIPRSDQNPRINQRPSPRKPKLPAGSTTPVKPRKRGN
jgi:hypothetical protein